MRSFGSPSRRATRPWPRWLTALPIACVVLLAIAAPSVAAQAPLAVSSASVEQHGRRLEWSVTLEREFSAEALKRQGRSLCLLLEARRSGSPFAEVCLAPPRSPGMPARLKYAPVSGAGHGPFEIIRAAVHRRASTLSASFLPAQLRLAYRSLRWQVRSGLAPPRCIPASAPPSNTKGTGECAILYPARPTLARLHVPKLVGCVASGSSLVFNGTSSGREIALTFDDGPWNDPPSIDFVNLLARYHVRATFFEIGGQIGSFDANGAVERRMLADGDMIGDHTWTHPDMVALSPSQQRFQLQATAAAIRRATGFTPCLWRPPYGDVSSPLVSLARSLGMLTIAWNVDPRDWSLPGVGAIESNVIGNASSGAIVDMHFGGGPRGQTLQALPNIITTLRSRGYRFVTVAELLGLRMIYG